MSAPNSPTRASGSWCHRQHSVTSLLHARSTCGRWPTSAYIEWRHGSLSSVGPRARRHRTRGCVLDPEGGPYARRDFLLDVSADLGSWESRLPGEAADAFARLGEIPAQEVGTV